MRASLRLKRTLAMAATGALVLTLLPGVAFADTVEFDDVCEGAADATFPDLGSTHADAISCMTAYGVIEGRTDGTFGTQVNIQRQQFASLIARFALVANPGLADVIDTSDFGFTDLVSVTHSPNVNALANLGLVQGTTATTFSPNAPLTRAQAATIFVNAHEALGVEFNEDATSTFTDLGATHEDAINKLVDAGIVEGYDDTTFGYSDPIQRGQIASLLARSAAVLDSLGLWEGVIDVPVDTNQTFMVSSDETQVPLGTEIEFTADVGDAEEVTIWLLDADDVDVDNGNVSFETDDDGDFAAGLADGGTQITDVDGVAVPLAQFRNVTTIEDGTVTFTVSAANNDAFVAFVAETEDFTAGDVPDVDADGVPEVGFGVSATINVQDVVGVALLDADRDAVTVFGVPDVSVRPEGETVNVTAVLFDNANPLAADAAVTAVGGSLSYVIADSAVAAGTDPGTIAGNNVVASGTSTVSGGVASFSFEGGDDLDIYTILVEWEGVEDSAYDGESAFAFALVTHGQVSFIDDEAAATAASFVNDEVFAPVNGTARVEAEVVDQFDNPVSGETVAFTVGGETFNRTSNAAGVATLAYSNDDNEQETVTAEVVVEDAPNITVEDGPVVVTWFTAIAVTAADGVHPLIGSDTANDYIYADALGGGTFVQVSYSTAAAFQIGGIAVSKTAFEAELDDDASPVDTVTISGALDVNAPLTFNIS